MGVDDTSLVVDGYPSIVADGDPRSAVSPPEPGDDLGGFGAMLSAVQEVVVGKRDVEGVQLRLEAEGKVALSFEGMVVAAKAVFPIGVPGT